MDCYCITDRHTRNSSAIHSKSSHSSDYRNDSFGLGCTANCAIFVKICLQYCDDKKVLRVLTIEPSFLQKLVNARYETSNGVGVMLDPVEYRQWISSLSNYIVSVEDKGYLPVIVCPEDVRVLVKTSIEREMPKVVVLSISEIDKEIKLESLGEVKVG